MENIICTVIKSLWIPPAILSLIIAAMLALKRQRESDFLEKDRIERQIKYPLFFFVLCLVSIPIGDFLLVGGIIPVDCETGLLILPSSSNTIKNFSDGSAEKNITFLLEGGFNSEVMVELPYNVKVSKARIIVEHPSQDMWMDDFYNLSLMENNKDVDVSRNDSYVFINMKTLVVDSTIELDGKNVYDEVHVKKGGRIVVGRSGTLDLLVRGVLTVDTGGEIIASRKTALENEDYHQYLLISTSGRASEAGGGGGGGYGGSGGQGGSDGSIHGGGGGSPFGFKDNPCLIGMSGGKGGGLKDDVPRGIPGTGGYGGGVLRIEAKRAVIDGTVSANGGSGKDAAPVYGTGGGGGGSGGSIIIVTKNLVLNGEITANGGNGGDKKSIGESGTGASNGGGGGGGGGRIMLVYEKKSGYGTVKVEPGSGGKSSETSKNGLAGNKGTIYEQQKEIITNQLIEANITSIGITPDNLKSWAYFFVNATSPSGSDVKYNIFDGYDDTVLCKIMGIGNNSRYDIEECANTADSIKFNAELVTVTFLSTPRIYNWGVVYNTSLKDFEIDVGIDQINEFSSKELSGSIIIDDENTNPKLSEVLTSYAKDCVCRGCTPKEESCKVTIRFASSCSGLLIVKNPVIEYVY